MTDPDGDTCRIAYDADGQPIVYRSAEPLTPDGEAALRDLVEAARRRFEADDAASGGELSRRQAASQERIRIRNERLRKGSTD